jgi:hypothetical protein
MKRIFRPFGRHYTYCGQKPNQQSHN